MQSSPRFQIEGALVLSGCHSSIKVRSAFCNLADLFVLPAFYKGFGIPALESNGFGCPLITTKAGCSPEVAGDAAILVDLYDPDEVAKAMSSVLVEDRLRHKLIEEGLQ